MIWCLVTSSESQRWPELLHGRAAHIFYNKIINIVASFSLDRSQQSWFLIGYVYYIWHLSNLNIFQINYDLFACGPGFANIRSQLESWVMGPQVSANHKTESTEVGQSDISRNISNDSHKFMVDSSFLRTIKTKGDRSHEIAICSDSFDITALLISWNESGWVVFRKWVLPSCCLCMNERCRGHVSNNYAIC